jgi:hypothetical protein
MKLSKALKLKNKKLKEYTETLNKAVLYNSYDVDSKQTYNSEELMATAVSLKDDYVALKTAIHSTSEPIRNKIFMLGELKNFMKKIEHLDTKEGVQKEGYREITTRTYAASITEENKNSLIKDIEDRIETLQDEIDTFNATTELVGY